MCGRGGEGVREDEYCRIGSGVRLVRRLGGSIHGG